MADYGYQYDSAGTRCLGEEQPGLQALRDYCLARWGALRNSGIYNCRNVAGTSYRSVHAEGRAWDAGVLSASAPVGTMLAKWLVKYAPQLGVQAVIWNRHDWDSRSRVWTPYGGENPHTDHVHVELCWDAARTLTVSRIRSATGGFLMALSDKEQEELLYLVRVLVRHVEGRDDKLAEDPSRNLPSLRRLVLRADDD